MGKNKVKSHRHSRMALNFSIDALICDKAMQNKLKSSMLDAETAGSSGETTSKIETSSSSSPTVTTTPTTSSTNHLPLPATTTTTTNTSAASWLQLQLQQQSKVWQQHQQQQAQQQQAHWVDLLAAQQVQHWQHAVEQHHHHHAAFPAVDPAVVSAAEVRNFFFTPFRKPKRIRTAFSPTQLLQLEHAFDKNHYVIGQERKQLAQQLQLSETQVKVWFQNRRTKHKRIKFEEDLERKTDDSGCGGGDAGQDRPGSGSSLASDHHS